MFIRKRICAMLVMMLFIFVSDKVYSQCTGCTTTINTNASPITVNAGSVVCITTNFSNTVTINGGTLCIASGKNFTSTSITINGACTIINNGNMTAAFTENSYVTLQNYGQISGAAFTQNGGSITNYNGAKFQPSSFTVTAGSFTNNSGGQATFPAAVTFPSGYTFTNNGQLTLPGFTVSSGATVILTGSSQTIGASIVDNGTLTYTLSGNFAYSVTVGSGGIMNLSGTPTFQSTLKDSGTINLNGSLTVQGLYSDAAGASIVETGTGCNTLSLSGGYVTDLGTFNGGNTPLQVSENPSLGCTSCLTNGAYGGTGTAPTTQPSSLSTSLSNLTLSGSFTAATGSINGYIVLRYVGTSAPSDNPQTGHSYTVGQAIGASTVAAVIVDPTSGTKNFTDVIPGGNCAKNVYYRIFAFQGCGSSNNTAYNTTSPLTGNLTLVAPSTSNAGTAISQCGNSAFTMAANNPAIGVGTWSIVSGSPTIANTALYNTGVTLSSGSATLQWTINSGGCTASSSTVTIKNTVVAISFSQTNVLCYGNSTGALTANPSGGTATYTYLWNTGATTQSITGLAIGSDSVTVTDANSCTATASATITQPSAALSDSMWETDVSYYGDDNGSVGIVVSGGTSPYTYHWSTGATTQSLTTQFQGNYYVTVTDHNGCTLSDSKTIGTPGQIASNDIDPVTSNLITAPAGTYVIAMDNELQQSGGVFNIKAYGLAMTILNNKMALTWVIKAGKGKDSVDFTAPATQVFPTYSASASRNFKAGPFLILPTDTGAGNVHTIVNAFNAANPSAQVNVYQLTTATVVDSRYALTQIPKAAILNDGGNASIHVNYFVMASVPTSNYYVLSSAAYLADSCYNFASEPHNDKPMPGVLDSLRSYVVNGGGNFLGQCHAIWDYEDTTNGYFQTTGGINIVNTSLTTMTYSHPDLPFQQYEGDFNPSSVGGSVIDWQLNPGSILYNNAAIYTSGTGSTSGVIGQSVSKLGTGTGHLVFYTGGHDYGKTDANSINGMRSYFNAMLTPCNVINCNFLRFDNDISVKEYINSANLYLNQRDTITIVATNDGPSAALAYNINLTNSISSDFTIISNSPSKGTYNSGTGLWTVGNMSLYESDTLKFVVKATTAGTYTNTVFENRNAYDYYQSNDTATTTGTIYACSASAGPDISQCNLNNFTMAATAACAGTGTWAVISGSGTHINNVNSATSTITVNPGVIATLTWTLTNGTAISVDTVVLINYSTTGPNNQPTALSLSMSGTTVNGSFIAPSPLTNVYGYLVFRNIGTSTPHPSVALTDNNFYTVGNTIGLWTLVAIITDSTAGTKTFTDNLGTGLCNNNAYYEVTDFDEASICIAYSNKNPLQGTIEYTPIYTWNKTTKNDYTVPGNWTPARNLVQTCDILYINNGGTDTLINTPATETITGMYVQSNTTAALQPAGASSVITFLKDPGSPTGVNVQAGSTLDAGTIVQFATSGAGVTHQVDGTLKTANPAGFSGTTSTTFSSTTNPTINLGSASTVFYNASSGSQTVTARSDYRNITFANNAYKTLAGSVLTTGTGNTVTITGGTVDALTYSLSQASATNLTITAGTLRMAMLNTTLPQLTGTYSITGGTVELYGAGAQVLRGAETYYNLLFSGSGTTTLSAAIATGTNEINGNVSIINTAIVDVQSYQFGSPVTTFTMTGGRFRTSYDGAVVPMMGSTYALSAGTVECYGTACTDSQTLRSGVTYFNVDANSSSTNFTIGNIKQQTGTLTIASGGTFTIYSPTIYSIDATSAIAGAGTFTMAASSGLFYGSAQGITPASCGTSSSTCGNILTVNRSYLPGTQGYLWWTY